VVEISIMSLYHGFVWRIGMIKEHSFSSNNVDNWLGLCLWQCIMLAELARVEIVAQCLFELDPENPMVCALISNLYMDVGRWRMKRPTGPRACGCQSLQLDSHA